MSGYPSGKMKLQIGYQTAFDEQIFRLNTFYQFTGLMGNVLIFNEVYLAIDIINRIYDLKGDYEYLLYRNYENFGGFLTNNLDEEKISTMKFFQTLDKYKFEHKIVIMVSSKSITSSSLLNKGMKLQFKENYAEINNKYFSMSERKYEFFTQPVPKHIATFKFENLSFINEFMNFDGIKLLCLYFIYYQQIDLESIQDDVIWENM